MLTTICRYFLLFMIFSVGGWIIETLLYMLRDKKAVKRGFLFGPVCPIYGVSAIICRLLFYGRVDNIFLLFVYGFLTTGLIEYITHFTMEKLFHATWWDYSNRRFNIKGRVYLKGLLIFGAGVILIIKYIIPLTDQLFDMMSITVLYSVSFALYSILIMDFATTIADLKGIVKILRALESGFIGKTQKGIDLTTEQMDRISEMINDSEIIGKIRSEFSGRNSILTYFKRRYPNFTLKKYKYLIDVISDAPIEGKERTDIKHYGTADSIPTVEDDSGKASEKPKNKSGKKAAKKDPKKEKKKKDGSPKHGKNSKKKKKKKQ